MAHRFQRTREGITARFDAGERDVLRSLFTDVAGLLGGVRPAHAVSADPLEAMVGITEGATLPEDPALARLLPDASRDDDEAAAEFRRLTERGLRERKQQALATAAATLDRAGRPGRAGRPAALVLDDAEAGAWLTALNDVRLVVAERMGLRTEEDAARVAAAAAGLPEEDPAVWLASVYDFLTWLLETLVHALDAAPGRP